jgi:hypothetical protein
MKLVHEHGGGTRRAERDAGAIRPPRREEPNARSADGMGPATRQTASQRKERGWK